jgi:hypothetical protein
LPSSYFSEPSEDLDPDLFTGGVLKESVRTGLLNLLYSDLENDVGLHAPWNWAHVWLAGSGISYQWSADRGPGDLDVLFGVALPQFLDDNPQFPRLSGPEVAKYVDQLLKERSWPKTRNVTIGGSKKRYEITFFWNPNVSIDISTIHPYAAYNLDTGYWDVRPPTLPTDPHELYPHQWYDFADADYTQAAAIKDMNENGGSLGQLQAHRAARTLWDSIHGGRAAAFSPVGSGYGDFHNFRWQRAKDLGTVDILRGFMDEAPEPDATPGDLVTRAAIRYAGPRYWQ